MVRDQVTNESDYKRFFENAELFEQLTGVGFWKVDLAESRLEWSDRTYRIFGVSPETFYPSLAEFRRFLHPEDRETVLNAIYSSRETGEPYQIEHRIIRADSKIRYVLQNGRHEFDKNGRAVVFRGTVQDVSSNALMRERLIRAERLATLSRLVGDIAHDINNLLTTVGGNLELLTMELGEHLNAERYINRARESLQSGASLCDRLLNFFDRAHLSSEVLDLVPYVDELVSTAKTFVGEHIDLVFEAGSAELLCAVNRARLESSILNALANARDAMPLGGQIKVSLAQAVLDGHSIPMACLSIEDNGIGIDPSLKDQLFEPFVSNKLDQGGTGLGLSIIRDFVQDCGGQVAIDSLPGVGTKLTLFLPLSCDRPGPSSRPISRLNVRGAENRILLVEDNQNVRMFVQDGLNQFGFNVVAFSSPVGALDHIQRSSCLVSAIVADVRLPGGLDGFEFINRVREYVPMVPVLFITGYAGEFERSQISCEPNARILRKPFQISELAEALNDLLR